LAKFRWKFITKAKSVSKEFGFCSAATSTGQINLKIIQALAGCEED